MEIKVTESNPNVPWLTRKIIKINKTGKTELILEHVHPKCYLSIGNYACPWHLLTEEEKDTRRYIEDKFTEVCDRLEMNVVPGVEIITDEDNGIDLHIEVVGEKVNPDNERDVYMKYIKDGYDRFNITSINERYPDGHGDYERTDFIYDRYGNYPKDADGNSIIEKWTYRYDRYMYFYKVI